MRRLPLKGLTAVLHGYADQHIAAVTSMVGSWIGNCETKSSDMLKAAYSTAIAQLSTPDITRLCSSVADLYQKIPEDTKKSIEKSVEELVKSKIGEVKADTGAMLASEGAGVFLGEPETERGLQPSDELMRVVQWMLFFQ